MIHAFEAPWRAIHYTLLALLQVGRTRPDSLIALRNCAPSTPPPPWALAITYESLRLYPPIRCAHRKPLVDIEAIQRDPQYWGHNANAFNPSRFLDTNGNIDSAMIGSRSAWMPFAVGRMKCPSDDGWSVRFIIVIIGEILRQLFPDGIASDWYLDRPEWDWASENSRPLRAGRDEYARVRVVISARPRHAFHGKA